MGHLKCLVALLSLTSMVTDISCRQYTGYKLMSVRGTNKEQFDFLNQQMEMHQALDFWKGPFLNHTSIVLVPPHLEKNVKRAWTGRHMTWEEMDTDVEKTLEAGSKKFAVPRAMGSNVIDHINYHDYDQITSYLWKLASTYPSNVQTEFLETPTFEGRSVAFVKLSGDHASDDKPSIMIEAGIHAREWISPAATLYFIETLVQRYKTGDRDAQFMLNEYNWYIIPITNPDGYEYTKEDRLWRKNRRPMSHWWYGNCHGVDLNRNFNFQFGTTGTSPYCSTDIYPGEKGNPEPETLNIMSLFNRLRHSIVAYVGVHAYSQYILVPWSYKESSISASARLENIAHDMSAAIGHLSGRFYNVGTPYKVLQYAASGSSMDWVYNEDNSLTTVIYELRPTANDARGFALPSTEIIPTGEELYVSLRVMAEQARR